VSRTARTLLAGILALAGAVAATHTSLAQCTYSDLTGGVTISSADQALPRFNQGSAYWTAIGVKGAGATDDWDITVYSASAAFPTCVTGPLASSSAFGSGVDFVIGDFNADGNAFGTYYSRVTHYSGSNPTGYVQWDTGTDVLGVNDYPTTRATGPTSVLECWDVFLEAGKTYTLTLGHGGSADLKAMLFRNPAASPYWVGRSSRVLEVTTAGTYVAPASDWYGVVVVNDNGGTDSYTVSVGTCDAPTALTSGVPSPASGVSAWRSFNQTNGYFTAVAARSDDFNQDWDLLVYGAASGLGFPNCFGSNVASSTYGNGATDFIVGDFNSGANTVGTYYARTYPYGGSTSTAHIEWDDGPDQLVVDAAPISRTSGANDLIECWDVFLNGPQNFGINFTHDGAADLKVFVFHNPGAGYWVGRSSADLVSTGNIYYSSPTADWYSIVVVNDNGQPGTYKLGIAQCAGLNTVPISSVFFGGVNAWDEVHPAPNAWMAFGVLNSPDAVGNWDMKMYRDGTGGVYPACASNLLGQSTLPAGKVDFVAGDFHYNAPGYYYPYMAYVSGASMNDKFEWDDGTQVITVNGPPIDRTSFGYGLLEVWDVFLTAGLHYNFQFDAVGPYMHMLLMRNPGASTYWAGRSSAVMDAAIGTNDYTPPTTGWYGVVVVNDDINNFGNFKLAVYEGNVGVGDSKSITTRLASISPNPTRAGARIDYELSEPAAVDFEIRDVAGRLVAQVSPGSRASGRWSDAWNGRGSDGRTVAPGLYFVRMKVAGRIAGSSTVVMLK
jgi:hypothetical protein